MFVIFTPWLRNGNEKLHKYTEIIGILDEFVSDGVNLKAYKIKLE